MKTDCNHKAKICTGITNGRTEYLCVRCRARLSGSRDGKVPKAPRGWQDMSPDELRMWYVIEAALQQYKEKLNANLSGHEA
jgi:hypothetical protein